MLKAEHRWKPDVSVVVAARNEEKNIGNLLKALTAQDYPEEKFQIIIVDDESKDRTCSIVEKFRESHKNISLVHVKNRATAISPKKNAIQLGIQHSHGNIILLTDADCVPPAQWISGIVRYFSHDVGMVIGFSPYELPALKTLFHRLLALDSLALGAVAAATAGLGRPATCSGRNIAYRRCVYDEIGGFEKIKHFISGDDDLFMRLVASETNWKIHYAYDPQVVVPTRLLANVKQFFNQRIRHASKGLHYNWKTITTLSLVYLYNLLLFVTLPVAIMHPQNFWMPFMALALKSICEFLFLGKFAADMKKFNFLYAFPVAIFLHIPYVVIFGALGQIMKFQWKERQFSKTA